jgi:peptide/nickel transport system substrate-binding protein
MRRVRVIVCVLATILTAATAAPARAENVVRWATPEPPLTWDPHGSDWAYSQTGYRHVYEGLTRLDPDLRLEPALSTSWKLVGPTTWRFELRQGVRFHDGSLLTAEDVAFSLGRAIGEGSQLRARAGSLERAVSVSPSTVDAHTTAPDLLLPVRLRNLFIMSRAWAEAHGVAAATPHDKDQGTYAREYAMGTGPFRLAGHEPGGRTVLVRNPDWWDAGQHPHEVGRVVWSTISDGGKRIAALLGGEADFVQAVSPGAVAKIRAAPGLKVAETPALRTFWLGFNQGLNELPSSDVKGRNPFRDRRVREAVYRAVNIDELIHEALGGAATPAGMIVAPGVNGWSEELDRRPPHDLEGARLLLAEAGYPDGIALRLSCRKSQEAPCRNIAGQLGGVGLRIRPTFGPTTPTQHCSMVTTPSST